MSVGVMSVNFIILCKSIQPLNGNETQESPTNDGVYEYRVDEDGYGVEDPSLLISNLVIV